MSGTAEGITPRPPALAADLWYNTTTALACGDASTPPAAVLACMQSRPARAILATLINTVASPNPGAPYSPTVDDRLVFSDPTTRPRARVPMLVGNTDNETGLFRVFVPPTSPNATVDDAFWRGESQRRFVCPAAARVARSVADGNPTWRYRWHGVFPGTELATRPASGAYHSSEMGVLFGTNGMEEGRVGAAGATNGAAAEEVVGRWMRGAWGAFARDPVGGLGRYRRKGEAGWPRYEQRGRTLVRIGLGGRAGRNLGRGDEYDDGC